MSPYLVGLGGGLVVSDLFPAPGNLPALIPTFVQEQMKCLKAEVSDGARVVLKVFGWPKSDPKCMVWHQKRYCNGCELCSKFWTLTYTHTHELAGARF